MPDPARPYDLVLLGATGFTGGLTATYLAGRVPTGARWAVAGRDRARLEAVRDRLTADRPSGVQPELVTADVTDAASLAQVRETKREAKAAARQPTDTGR